MNGPENMQRCSSWALEVQDMPLHSYFLPGIYWPLGASATGGLHPWPTARHQHWRCHLPLGLPSCVQSRVTQGWVRALQSFIKSHWLGNTFHCSPLSPVLTPIVVILVSLPFQHSSLCWVPCASESWWVCLFHFVARSDTFFKSVFRTQESLELVINGFLLFGQGCQGAKS